MIKAWERWKKIAEGIGNFQASVVFSFLYFILVTPYGIISSIFNDHFNLKSKPSWKKINEVYSSLTDLKKQ